MEGVARRSGWAAGHCPMRMGRQMLLSMKFSSASVQGRWLDQHPSSAGTSGKSLSSLTCFALFFTFWVGEELGAYSGFGSYG